MIDPATGDDILPACNGDNPLVVITCCKGPALPKPAAITLFGAGVVALGLFGRCRT
ncbi:MAG: hypothetical protein P4L71_04255 [Acetobacteraceae bacterium]|nr:hypothetical protein [Acetobacteraceae bacterium]